MDISERKLINLMIRGKEVKRFGNFECNEQDESDREGRQKDTSRGNVTVCWQERIKKATSPFLFKATLSLT